MLFYLFTALVPSGVHLSRRRYLVTAGSASLQKKSPTFVGDFFGTPSRNRTCNCPLGGDYYIHLTMRAGRPKVTAVRFAIGEYILHQCSQGLFQTIGEFHLPEVDFTGPSGQSSPVPLNKVLRLLE